MRARIVHVLGLLNIAPSELILIAAVAVIIFGKNLPQVAGRCRGPGIRIVDKGHTVADEDIILDGYALTDERVTGNLASSADDGVLLNLDEGSDFGFVADLASIQIDELGQLDMLPQFHVWGHCRIVHRAPFPRSIARRPPP